MTFIHIRYFLFVLFMAMAEAGKAQEIFSLDHAINLALEQNFAIRLSEANKKMLQLQNSAGFAGASPTVTGSAIINNTINNSYQEFFNNVREPISQGGIYNRNGNVGVNASWTIYNGGGIKVARQKLQTLEKAGEINADIVAQNIVAQVSVAYYDIIRQSQRIKVFRKALEISSERIRLAKDRYDVGQGSKLDYLSGQVDYNSDKAALVAQEQVIENTKVTLNALLARSPNTSFAVSDTIMPNYLLDLATIQEKTLQQNPTIILLNNAKKVTDLDITARKTDLLPKIDALAGYNTALLKNGGTGFGVQYSEGFVGNLGIRTSINIFDGYNQKRRIDIALVNKNIIELQKNDVQIQLSANIQRTYLSYKNALQLITLEIENLRIVQQNVAIAIERYKVGVATPLELREAQRSAVAAETRLIDAAFNSKITEIELLRLSGDLLQK